MPWPSLRKSGNRFLDAALLTALMLAPAISGCSAFHQPGSELAHVYSRIYLTDYNTAWQAVLEAMKNHERTVTNRQGGVIQTAWSDNTTQKSFSETFGGAQTFNKAKYRMSITVAPGNYNGKPSVKVSIQKEQLVQRDMLEGWKQVPSDAVDENTVLYRIGRLIYTKLRLKQVEEERTREVLEGGV